MGEVLRSKINILCTLNRLSTQSLVVVIDVLSAVDEHSDSRLVVRFRGIPMQRHDSAVRFIIDAMNGRWKEFGGHVLNVMLITGVRVRARSIRLKVEMY